MFRNRRNKKKFISLTLSAPKAILRFLQTILIQASQLVTSCLTWNQHGLPFIYQNSPKPVLHEKWRCPNLNIEESTLNNSALKELNWSQQAWVIFRDGNEYSNIRIFDHTVEYSNTISWFEYSMKSGFSTLKNKNLISACLFFS